MRENIFSAGLSSCIIVMLCLLTIGCSSSAGPEISIENAWGPPSPQAAKTGVFYMLIINKGNESDMLIAGSSPACGVVEFHETFQADEGVMEMRPVEGNALEVPANSQIELKTGGLHIMCIQKLANFEVGSILPLTLEFNKSGQFTVDVQIREP